MCFKNEDRLIPGGRAIKDDGEMINRTPRCLRDSNILRWAAKTKILPGREITVKCMHVEANIFFLLDVTVRA